VTFEEVNMDFCRLAKCNIDQYKDKTFDSETSSIVFRKR